ncbi:MAG: COG4223 family protein [Xanthobacteraceae bacterium]
MTSEPASTPRRRPPTIDLTATEVEVESPRADGGETGASGEHPTAQAAPERGAGRSFAAGMGPPIIGAVIGAIVVAAIGFGLWSTGVVPVRNGAPPATKNTASAISAQLDKIQTELQSRSADTALSSRLATVDAQIKSLNDSLAAINRRLDDIAVTAKTARERADAAAAAAGRATQNASAASAAANSANQNASAASAAAKGAAQSSVQRSDLDALAARIAALEKSITTLSSATAQKAMSSDDRAARAAVAAEALRASVERGVPYAAELTAVKSFGADQNAVGILEPFARSGVPTDAELVRELTRLVPSLQPPSVTPAANAGLLGRLESNAKSLVHITPVNRPQGDDASSVVAQLETDAAHADVAAALNDIGRLPQTAKARAAAWVQKASARNAAIAASRRIAADSLAALGHTATQ